MRSRTSPVARVKVSEVNGALSAPRATVTVPLPDGTLDRSTVAAPFLTTTTPSALLVLRFVIS